MSRSLRFLLLCIAPFLGLPLHARDQLDFNDGWRFAKGPQAGAEAVAFDDASWQTLRLPHDWSAAGPFDPDGDGDTGKLPWRGEGWYRKNFTLKPDAQGQRVFLLFDGVMAFPTVYVNGKNVGGWDYGYNSFHLDITDAVSFDNANTIAVHATTERQYSRWYPGGGIYRKVTLVLADPIHVPIWGTYVTTPEVTETYAEVRALTDLRNDSDASANIEVVETILSPEGNAAATAKRSIELAPRTTQTIERWTTLTRPERWDVDHPARYTLVTELRRDGATVDRYETPFGIRSFRFTADDGLWLNGRRLQLHGVNLHHDQGPLGAALLPRALERQLQIMKEMGVNAIRSSHNVPAPELPELCDKMGLVLLDELFDKWDGSAGFDPKSMDFDSYFERQTRNFLLRDRNHPSILVWSVGNEIRDVQSNRDFGLERLHKVTNFFRKYDPSRPTTMVCDVTSSVRFRHFDYYDIHSWNYDRRYRPAREADPTKPVIISESASTVSTRSFYDPKLPSAKTDFRTQPPYQVSSYDLNAPSWAEPADDDFKWQEEDRYVVGEFVWTGFDYLGEPTPYNNDWARKNNLPQSDVSRSSYFGIVDLCGFPKDRYYLYRSYWRPDAATVHILPHWNWQGHEGETIPVFVYTNGDQAELFLNGKSLGWRQKQPRSDNSVERYRLMWNDVVYEPGELRVVAYKDGAPIGEAVTRTADVPAQLRAVVDRTEIRSNGDDLAYVTIDALDRNGTPAPLANNTVSIRIEGPVTLAGVDNGDPRSLNSFQSNSIPLFNGKALLVLRSKRGEAGNVTVTLTSSDLQSAQVTLVSRK